MNDAALVPLRALLILLQQDRSVLQLWLRAAGTYLAEDRAWVVAPPASLAVLNQPLPGTAAVLADGNRHWVIGQNGRTLMVERLDRCPAEPPAGARLLIDQRAEQTAGVAAAVGQGDPLDPSALATRFWASLHLALGALGREAVFAAHGHLEVCRVCLLHLYRTALAPEAGERDWTGLDGLPGARVLEPVAAWLVAPLQLREQWRCASRLASAFEGLLLPLVERTGIEYPWVVRNLAFQRLAAVRPRDPAEGHGAEPPPAPPASPAPEVQGGGRAPVRIRLRRRPE